MRIRKVGANTRFVAEALAKYLGIHQRDMSYAGMKDRHAVTEQTMRTSRCSPSPSAP